jgi:hypothetical protein
VADEIELGAIDFEDTDFEDWVGFYRSFVWEFTKIIIF